MRRRSLTGLPRLSRVLISLTIAGCSGAEGPAVADGTDHTLVVFNAGSLARPLRAALDTFALASKATIEQESAGSLETARKLTELGKIPDVIALADYNVFPKLLVPEHVTWYAQFARNRMVIAYTPSSRGAREINAGNWWRILLRPDVEVGRSDPNLDPNGYRTLISMKLVERHTGMSGLAARMLANAPPRNVRPKEVELVGLLQAGELDYIWSYESVAQAANLSYLRLPPEVDLGSPELATWYAQAAVRVAGKRAGDTIEVSGEPIVYAVSIPRAAPNPALAERFVVFLLSEGGQRVLRNARLDALEKPVLVGTGAPESVAALGSRP